MAQLKRDRQRGQRRVGENPQQKTGPKSGGVGKRQQRTGPNQGGGRRYPQQKAPKPTARRDSEGGPRRKKPYRPAAHRRGVAPIPIAVLKRFELLLQRARGANPRARKKAVRRMLKMCSRKCPSLIQHYSAVGELCKDSDPSVRSNALKLLTLLAQTRKPSETVENERGRKVTYWEEAFTRVCVAMNDFEPRVRAVAAELMGRYTKVSFKFLSQTLFRRLTYSMREVVDQSAAGGESKKQQVQKLGSDIQMEEEAEIRQSVIPPGACGAFITALEDEFAFVRRAAIKSIGLLCASRPEFMPYALDQFVDMFNDQLHDVRLTAIETLAPMISSFTIRADQMDPILGVLDDRNADVRRGVQKVISQFKVDAASSLEDCITRLLTSMSRFPADKSSIYGCLCSLGLGHTGFVEELVYTLLGIHPLFAYPETPIDNDFYVGKLMLVLNAASSRPSIGRLLPAHVKRHYRFLRYAYSDMVNPVQELESECRYPNIPPGLFKKLSTPRRHPKLEPKTDKEREVKRKREKTPDSPEDTITG